MGTLTLSFVVLARKTSFLFPQWQYLCICQNSYLTLCYYTLLLPCCWGNIYVYLKAMFYFVKLIFKLQMWISEKKPQMGELPPQHRHTGKKLSVFLESSKILWCSCAFNLSQNTASSSLYLSHLGYGQCVALQCCPVVPLDSLASNAFRDFSLADTNDQRD